MQSSNREAGVQSSNEKEGVAQSFGGTSGVQSSCEKARVCDPPMGKFGARSFRGRSVSIH